MQNEVEQFVPYTSPLRLYHKKENIKVKLMPCYNTPMTKSMSSNPVCI